MRSLVWFAAAACVVAARLSALDIVAVTDGTNYNAGSEVSIRVTNGFSGKLAASIRYAGEAQPVVRDLSLPASPGFTKLWTIPPDARTGRYEVDVNGNRNVTSFAVHRKSARIARVELERTFYSNGDPINCKVTIRNLLNHPLEGVRVEFAPFYYPWIAPAPDDPKMTPAVLTDSLTLPAGGEKELIGERVAVARVGDHPRVTGYAIVVWDRQREHVLDLAFTPPVFLRPPNTEYPKAYPFLYLYPTLADVAQKATAYRDFYPPDFVSPIIQFDTSHTIFPSGTKPDLAFHIHPAADENVTGAKLRGRVLNTDDSAVSSEETMPLPGSTGGHATLPALPDGRYIYQLSLVAANGTVMARNKIEFALDALPKSILIFCAHQDDDTAHPALIRAAIENHIPIHIVYFTSGDAGGCDRYYQNSCDAARAMDFGETRMAESRASLAHLGVPPEDVSFLGLPDGGMEEIWLNHHTAADPYLSVLLASDHAPYTNLVQPNLPFSRDPVVDIAKDFIRKYQPELIVTGHPEERHVDHRTNNWIVVRAMQALLREGAISPQTRMLVDLSYGGTSWIHSPYRYEHQTFYVPGEVAKLGQEALWFYQTQDGNHQQGDLMKYAKLPRGEAYPHLWLLDWQKYEGWNEHNLAAAASTRTR